MICCKMAYKLSLIALLSILVIVLQSNTVIGENSPWSYKCDSKRGVCVKEEATDSSDQTSLARCKLACASGGVLWPLPTSVSLTDQIVEFSPKLIESNIDAPSEAVDILDQAVDIFIENVLKSRSDDSLKSCSSIRDGEALCDHSNGISASENSLIINITVTELAPDFQIETNETYSLDITTEGSVSTAVIDAPNFFGARHALETLSQLTDYDEITESFILVSEAEITDTPFYPHRGLGLDTARNFIPIDDIKRTLDGMAANKLNTFNWHISDSQSFPMYIKSFPNISYYGAYSPSQVYQPVDIKQLVDYARVRGIRIMPSVDAPAHIGNGFQWGPLEGYGNLAVCLNEEPWTSYCVEPPCGQLNIANEKIYEVLDQIYKDIIDAFAPVDVFHFGGDEININCWNTSDEILEWMSDEGYDLSEDSYYDQWGVFQNRSLHLLNAANNARRNKTPAIVWTSALTTGDRLEKYLPKEDYIIQIWSSEKDPVIGELLDKGYRVIFSNYDSWYLDCGMGAWVGEGNSWCDPYKGWQTVYDNDPMKIAEELTDSFNPRLIIGGDVVLWSEQVDTFTVDSRLWPRGAALGERLWTNPEHSFREAEIRLINQRQRMVKRGIKAARVQPEWCYQNEGLCHA